MNSKDSGYKSPFPEPSLPGGVTPQTWRGQPGISETPGLMKTDHVGPSDSLRFSGWMFLLLWVFKGFEEGAGLRSERVDFHSRAVYAWLVAWEASDEP